MSRLSQRLMDVQAIKQTIDNTGEFRVHLKYSRGGTVTARIWHPDGFKVGSAGGGGYDKRGTALGQAIELFFAQELKDLPLPERDDKGRTVRGFYGMGEGKDGKRYLDGSCGIECMIKILEALGFKARVFSTGKDADMLLAERGADND